MNKQYKPKQKKQQGKKAQVTKLQHKHLELGFREKSKTYKYYTIATNSRGKEQVLEYESTTPLFARLAFEEEAKLHSLTLNNTIHVYK